MTSTTRNGIRRLFDTKKNSFFAMELIKLVVCISVLVTQLCSAGLIIETSKHDESPLIETLIDILESCYTDRFDTVGFAGPSARSMMTKMSTRATPIPVAMINHTSSVNRVDIEYRHKLNVFVITSSDQKPLNETITQVLRTKWWNHMASFFFIDSTDSEDGCSNAADILLDAWYCNLLNSKFLCLHETRGQLIYTFNPYTNKAPNPWHQEGTYEGINGHPWTLFAREYREDESYCDELDFDKTIDLGGYEIRAVGNYLEWWFPDFVTEWLLSKQRNVTFRFLERSLNATWNVTDGPDRPYLLNYYCNETFFELADVVNQIYDIYIESGMQQGFYRFETTDIIVVNEIMFFTHYPGHKSQLDKLLSVLDISSRFGVLAVLMVTLMFLKFWVRQPLIPSILDIFLLICNAGIQRVPRDTASRIYLSGLFIFVVTIQGIYSGIFASLLTKDVRIRPIDTVNDLARSNHKIYGPWAYNVYFHDKAFTGRYGWFSKIEEEYLRDPKVACVEEYLLALDYAEKYNLHVARESLGQSNSVYLVRNDWPLKERVSEIYRRANSGGLLETLKSRDRDRVIRSLKSYETHDQDPEVKVLTLQQLGFAFVILGIGLVCATITFIIELAIARKAIANRRNRIQRFMVKTYQLPASGPRPHQNL